jgi:hypothetical protein
MNPALFAADTLETSRTNRDAGTCAHCDGQTKPSDQGFSNDYRYD